MIETFDFEQNSPEWHEIRKGIITASEFKTVLMKGKGGGESETRKKYMYRLAAESIRGIAGDSFSTIYTQRGHDYEDEAVSIYEQIAEVETKKCTFIRNKNIGYSPDRLVGDDGLVEIKTKSGEFQAEILFDNAIPKEHIAQLQGGLLVSKRKWIDFVSYCPGLPPFIRRVERDEDYITQLLIELARFQTELQIVIEKIVEKF